VLLLDLDERWRLILAGCIVALTLELVDLILHPGHLSVFSIVIIVVLLHLDERVSLRSFAVFAACSIVALAFELVDLVLHAGHLSVFSVVVIVVLLLDLDERWRLILAGCIVALTLELVDLILHPGHLSVFSIVIIVVSLQL